ncbi:hypothetical protein ACIA5G_39835 [Amycolatopsis sp. NPDC051758]|uniref:hypothetical protein n=1 Tax=Amycolatopsis sp. NPDC051758 TaxID=3363935 RepID=UPI0037B1DCAE
MTTRPAVRHGDILIVAEGAARLSWARTSVATWRPIGLWPSRDEQAAIAAHVDAGAPLLVVLAEMPTIVPILPEELIDAPQDLVKLAEFTGYVGELEIPFLGWLPPQLRARGRQFFEGSRAMLTATPRELRSPLLLETPPASDLAHVRFARWLRSGHPPVDDLIPAADRIFFGGPS